MKGRTVRFTGHTAAGEIRARTDSVDSH